jgi:membrane fusion protein, multidrug efflux system
MDNISTEIEARRLIAPRPSKPGVKAWAGSLIALGLVAGGVVAGPRLLAPSADQAAVVTPPVVAVSVPLQRDVDTRLQFLGQLLLARLYQPPAFLPFSMAKSRPTVQVGL